MCCGKSSCNWSNHCIWHGSSATSWKYKADANAEKYHHSKQNLKQSEKYGKQETTKNNIARHSCESGRWHVIFVKSSSFSSMTPYDLFQWGDGMRYEVLFDYLALVR
jgi:hypothetical protein